MNDLQFYIKDFKAVITNVPIGYLQLVKRHHYQTLWTYFANCILGLFLLTQPFLFDYKSQALVYSDSVCGVLIILFEFFAFTPTLAQLRWLVPAVAFWLLLAPFIFWSPTATVYLIDTLVACLLIAFSILVPGLPGRGKVELAGPDIPPGWTYNPSSWIRRWLGIALALLGFFISRYLAAHQLGYIQHAWDPFFGDGSDKVTGSALSRSFPISDAGFGSVAYMMEVLTGFMGDRARWRTAPFIAVMFALLVLPLGVTSIVLVIMQPIVVGAWCGLCLISAVGLIMSVPLAVHEAIAVGQFLIQAKRQNKNFWQIFWMGGAIEDDGNKDPDRTRYSLYQRWVASVQGVTVPWTIVCQIIIGIWLMMRPNILPFAGITANCDHLLGAIIVTIAAVASAEVTRAVRFINIFVGLILMVVALMLARDLPLVFCSEFLSGVILALVSFPKGSIVEKYSGWDRFIR